MPKQQINIKLPPALIEALKSKAADEGMTLTDLIQGYCERGLGFPRHSTESNLDAVYERIVNQLDERIPSQIDERIPERVDERIALQLAPLQERVATLETELQDVVGELFA